MKIEVIKLGTNFNLQAELEARIRKPLEITDNGMAELKKAMEAKKKEEAKKQIEEEKNKEVAEWQSKCEKAIALLETRSAKNSPTSSSELLAEVGLKDGDFKNLMTKMKRLLKEKGVEIQKSTRKGVLYFTLVKFEPT